MVEIDPLTMMLISGGIQLLGGIGQQGAQQAENQREDKYNAQQAQGMYDFTRDYLMAPIGPPAGMPTLNDPSAFGMMAPQAQGQMPMAGMNPEAMSHIMGLAQGLLAGQGQGQTKGKSQSVSTQSAGGQGGGLEGALPLIAGLLGNVAGPSLPGLFAGGAMGNPGMFMPNYMQQLFGGGMQGGR